MELDLYNCPHCNTKGVLPMADFCCPNCKTKMDSTMKSQGTNTNDGSPSLSNLKDKTSEYILERPTSVTVISWILIIWSVFVLVVSFGMGITGMVMMSEYKAPLILILAGVITALPHYAMGKGMLNAKNWARLLYLWLMPILIVFYIFGGNGLAVFYIISYIIFAIYLTRPVTVAYFNRIKDLPHSSNMIGLSATNSLSVPDWFGGKVPDAEKRIAFGVPEDKVPKRPTGVTIIAVLCFLGALLRLVTLLTNPLNPYLFGLQVPVSLLRLVGLVAVVLLLYCGMGFLKLKSLARKIYLWWITFGVLDAILNTIFTPVKMGFTKNMGLTDDGIFWMGFISLGIMLAAYSCIFFYLSKRKDFFVN